jgi:hypothetical protein
MGGGEVFGNKPSEESNFKSMIRSGINQIGQGREYGEECSSDGISCRHVRWMGRGEG